MTDDIQIDAVDRPAYIGGDPNEIRVQPSGLRDGWIYVMAYHATMNPAAARELALRLSRAAYQVDGKHAGYGEDLADRIGTLARTCIEACGRWRARSVESGRIVEDRDAIEDMIKVAIPASGPSLGDEVSVLIKNSTEADDLRAAIALHAQSCEAEIARRIADAVSAAMAMVRLPGVFVVPACAECGLRPAVCIGCYDSDDGIQRPACGECCGHGCEDGKCRPLDVRDWSTVVSKTSAATQSVVEDLGVDLDVESSAFLTWRQVCRRLVHLALVTDGSAFDAEAVMRVQVGDDLHCGGIRSLNVDCGCTDDPALVIDGDDDGAADVVDQDFDDSPPDLKDADDRE